MQLSKHHGLGNDFLVLLDGRGTTPIGAATARALCDRRRGVGADGVIRVAPGGPGSDVTMHLRNGDGSAAEMSGNGIRCLAQAVARERGVDHLEMKIATGGGLRPVALRPGPDPATAWVEVDMGVAREGPAVTSVTLDPSTKTATVDFGNPHLVMLVDDADAIDLGEAGPRLSAQFEHGVNVELVELVPGHDDALAVRVWERGAGITEACGTGAAAAAVAVSGWGLVGESVTVRMPGGVLEVRLGDTVVLAGPARFVADVSVPDETLPHPGEERPA